MQSALDMVIIKRIQVVNTNELIELVIPLLLNHYFGRFEKNIA